MSKLKSGDIVIWDDKSSFEKCSSVLIDRVYVIKEDFIGLHISEPFMDKNYNLDGFIIINDYVKREFDLEVGDSIMDTKTNKVRVINGFCCLPIIGLAYTYLNERNILNVSELKGVVNIIKERNKLIDEILK